MTDRWRVARFHLAWRRLVGVPAAWLQQRWVRRGMIAATCAMLLAAVCGYAIPAAVRWFEVHPYFAITTIAVQGQRRLSRDEVLRDAGVQRGMSIWDVDPTAMQLRLEQHEWIRWARVRRLWPDGLRIAVHERRPVAIVRLETFNYVDRTGHVLGPLRANDSWDFPIITGLEDSHAQEFAPVGMRRALRLLRRCKRLSCFDGVSEVHVDARRGVTVFPLRTAVAVVLGWGSWRQKLARSARVLAAWKGQEERLAAVDVSFRDLVVVKLRTDAHPAAVRDPKHRVRV
jgi:cell division septal protein FtsQ